MANNLVSLNRSRPDAEEPNQEAADKVSGASAGAPSGSPGADEPPIRVTDVAAQEILRQAIKRGTPHAAVRVGLRGGGCTGYSYVFDWVDGEPRRRDTVIETQGVRLVVDPKSLELLRGMELDFHRGLMSHGFHFNNPNAKGSCGCGAAVQF